MSKDNQYPIYINQLEALNQMVQDGNYSKILVITDENIEEACLPLFKSEVHFDFDLITIEPGEHNKDIHTCIHIWEDMLRYGADRHTLCINLGGGVIGDMGGFTANTYMRGMEFVQVPTTLLAQVDASVGGKLGIDFHGYKNLIGSIVQPAAVFIHTDFLETLPYRHLVSGFAEVLKHGLIQNKDAYNRYKKFVNLEAIQWPSIVEESIQIKRNITDQDPFETGIRKILNFGHTVGHAVESFHMDSERPMLHGEAIAIGMVVEAYLSKLKGWLTDEEVIDIKKTIVRFFDHHPERIPSIETLVYTMEKDKKNQKGNIHYSLLKSIGEAIYDVQCTQKEVIEALQFYQSPM